MEAVGEATGDVTDSLLGCSFFFCSRVAPRFVFPLPRQDRKFIVKADYSSIYPPAFPPPTLFSALRVFRLAAGSYRLTRLQPNIHLTDSVYLLELLSFLF